MDETDLQNAVDSAQFDLELIQSDVQKQQEEVEAAQEKLCGFNMLYQEQRINLAFLKHKAAVVSMIEFKQARRKYEEAKAAMNAAQDVALAAQVQLDFYRNQMVTAEKTLQQARTALSLGPVEPVEPTAKILEFPNAHRRDSSEN